MRLFVRSIDVDTDARLRRFISALRQRSRPYFITYWHRRDEPPTNDPFRVPFCHAAPIGARWRNAVGLAMWNLHIARTIWRYRRSLTSVQAIDLDCALTAGCCCFLLGIPFIFDIYDSYPDSRSMHGVVATAARRIEGWLAKRAALTIIADAGRRRQHGIADDVDVMVVENVPATDWSQTLMPDLVPGRPIVLGYLGNLETRHRGLEDVLTLVAGDDRYRLLIAGTGALEQTVRQAANACDRIVFFGPVEHHDGMALMARCHILLGLYYLSVPNHRYAAPNKYYEHLILGRPLLTTRSTPPGNRVRQHETGWAVDDGAASIEACLGDLVDDHAAIVTAGARARALWDRNYANYVSTVIDVQYVDSAAAIESGAII
ncbi:glycosyltransferase (plasmid) [Sphingomonadaceae bacterium OTU29LAMAA1]|nr:glycosyltransferase [Sphingomonadaceae bacterium OTU29LAMAA1]